MPRAKKVVRRKRVMRKRKRRQALTAPLRRKLLTKLRYADSKSVVSSLAVPSDIVYTCNGLYDPDVSGTGHQPRGFDELMDLYNHYVVIGANITVEMSNLSTSDSIVGYITVRDSATAISSPSDVMEGTKVLTKILTPVSGQSKAVFKMKLNPNKFMSRSKPLSDPDIKGSTTANPVEQCYFHFGHFCTDQTSTSTAEYLIHIDYICVLIEPRNPAQS